MCSKPIGARGARLIEGLSGGTKYVSLDDPRYVCTSGRRRRWNRRHCSANCLVVADFRASTRDAPPGRTPHGRHLMGRGVLPPPSTWRWDIMLVATCIHFALSIAYAVIPALLAWRLRTVSALFAGALYGLAICGVNLYGLTVIFPWFIVTRDRITVLTHVVFGITLAGSCKLLWFARAITI